MTRTLVTLTSFLSASTIFALPAAQVQIEGPSSLHSSDSMTEPMSSSDSMTEPMSSSDFNWASDFTKDQLADSHWVHVPFSNLQLAEESEPFDPQWVLDKTEGSLKAGWDPSENNNLAIRWASRNGLHVVVDRLLEEGRVDPATHDNDAIQSACREGHLIVVELLLKDARVKPTHDDLTKWAQMAEVNDHKEVAQLVRDYKA